MHHNINNLLLDAGSMQARKKRRRATPALAGQARETDRIGMNELLRLFTPYHAGEQAV